jgi:glycosyltransferase involved in cell wall biosynthesis
MPIVILLINFYKKHLKNNFFWSETQKYSVGSDSAYVEKFRSYMYKKFDNYLVPNQLSKDFVLKYSTNKSIFYLPNTIDQQIFNEINSSIDFEYSNNNTINIIQISQLEDRKGVIELINNFQKLPSNIMKRFNLYIVGNGTLREKIAQKIKYNSNIIVKEYLTQIEILSLYKRCDFFILASFKDPNPLSPIEAIFSGKITFISQFVGNVNELIPRDLSDILVFNPNVNFQQIFYTMLELSNNAQQKEEIKEKLSLNVLQKWDVNNVCNNLISNLNLVY